MPDDTPVPDYDSTTVWSNDLQKWTKELLAKHDGDINKAIKALFGGSCSYQQARIYSEALAAPFGLTTADFMKKYRYWRRGQL